MTATCYIAAHPADARWMIGETVAMAKHAFRTTGYDLASIRDYAAGQMLKVLRITPEGILQPVFDLRSF